MTDPRTNELLQQLHTIIENRGIFDNITRTQVQPTQRRIPECPGLNRVKSRAYRWTVPHGSSPAEETYCERCTAELGISGIVHQTTNCNCDSFLRKNKADNGIINISFWEPKLNKFYTTEVIEEASVPTYFVNIPSGHKFCILLQAQNTQNRTFRYEIEYIGAGKDEPSFVQSESMPFVHDSTFVSDKGDKIHFFDYVDSQNPCWKLLEQHKIVNPGDSLVIKIHMYDIIKHDFMTDSGRDLGQYTLTVGKTIQPKNTGNLNKEQNRYDHRPSPSIPSRAFERYTKTPMQMRFIFITDPNVPDSSDKLLKTALSSAIKSTQSQIRQATTTLARVKQSHQKHISLLEQKIAEAQQELDENQALLEKLNQYSSETGSDNN